MYDMNEIYQNYKYFYESVKQVNEFWYNSIVSSFKEYLKF